jgi:lon-related putative ATP-dependent protease
MTASIALGEADAGGKTDCDKLRLTPDQLRRSCGADDLAFTTTDELAGSLEPIGQARAVDALNLAVGVAHVGYNLFALGPAGVGKRTTIEALLRTVARGQPRPDDWCYVNNFVEPRRPIAIAMPAGQAAKLKKDMARWIEELRTSIPATLESDEYRARLEAIDAEYTERQSHAFEVLGEEAARNGIALVRTPTGFSFAPLLDKEVMSPEVYHKLPEEQQREIGTKIEKYQAELEHIVREAVEWRRERADRVRALTRELIGFAVARLTEEVRGRYLSLPQVMAFIDAAKEDVILHAEEFRKSSEPQVMMLPGMGARSEIDFRRYEVNVLVDHDAAEGAPVVVEEHPTFPNLLGRLEHLSQLGTLVTDFSLIRAGALHRARGGYLLIDALKLLTQPFSWEGLKRALTARKLTIESAGQAYGLFSTVTLEPDPIPCEVKVVLFGSREIYYLLSAHDPEFANLFKLAAEFTDEIPWNDTNRAGVVQMMATMIRERKLRPFDRGAIAAMLGHCARLADDSTKLSLHRESIDELLVESDYQAKRAPRSTVTAADVRSAIAAQRVRANLIEERLREAIERDIVMIDTTGSVVGQVNGPSVFQLGRTRFGQPTRITATTRLGKGELIDIHREVALGGPIHSKGVLTLSAFLAARFARLRALSLHATISFEQTYGTVEGDSASVAELVALVSSLADVPLRQDLAITGSMNQRGQVQAIGGVNEKVEGFFDLCASRGLTGTQGVVIPAANRQHLMLREDVVQAAAEGKFNIYAIAHSDEALSLLTGQAAGIEDARGDYAPESVNGRVAARLLQLHGLTLPKMDRRQPPKRSLANRPLGKPS